MKIKTNIIKLAQKTALNSNHYVHKMSAIVMFGGRPVSIGNNQKKTHPLLKKYNTKTIHAEMSVILKLKNRIEDFGDYDIFVFRETPGGNYGLAKPCETCQRFLKDVGFKSVYYTNGEGEIANMSL